MENTENPPKIRLQLIFNGKRAHRRIQYIWTVRPNKNYSFFKKTFFLRQQKGSFFIIEKNIKGGMISYFGRSMQRQMIFFKTNKFSGAFWRRETKNRLWPNSLNFFQQKKLSKLRFNGFHKGFQIIVAPFIFLRHFNKTNSCIHVYNVFRCPQGFHRIKAKNLWDYWNTVFQRHLQRHSYL